MKELSDLAYAKQKRVLYTRHQYFIDFEELKWDDGDPPVYINLIRDPIDRFKSFYYFSRYGNKRAQVKPGSHNFQAFSTSEEKSNPNLGRGKD